MTMDPTTVGPAITAMSTGLGTFGSFMPRLSDVRKADPRTDTATAADVRHGELMAVGVTVGVGVIISSLTKSAVPTYVAVAVALGLVLMYEHTLRSTPTPTEVPS